MSWTTGNGDMVPSTDTGTANESVTHAVSVTATPDTHNTAMHARVFFAEPLNPPPGVDEANNVPDYEYRFESDVIMVECKYLFLRLHLFHSVFFSGRRCVFTI